MFRRHRTLVAVLGSLLVHGLLLLWLARRPAAAPPARGTPPLVVDLRYLPSVKPSSKPAAKKVAVAPGVASSVRRSDRADTRRAVPPAAAAGTPEGPRGNPADHPIAHSLVPNLPPGAWEGPGVDVPSHGQTIRNDGSEPDPKAVAAYNAERVARTVQGWTLEELAGARAQRTAMGPYLSSLKGAFEEELDGAPPPVGRKAFEDARKAGSAVVSELADQASRYAKTGNPLEAVDPDRDDVETRYSPNAQAVLRDPAGNTPQGQIGAALLAMEPAKRMIQRAQEQLKLSAIIELLQGRDGSVREAKVVKTSGNKVFDDGVLAAAPKAAAKLPAPSGPGLGTNPEQIHSVWEFEGQLRYRRKASEIARHGDKGQLALDALAAIGSGAAAFDETTGSVELLDLAHPTLEFRARLIKLY